MTEIGRKILFDTFEAFATIFYERRKYWEANFGIGNLLTPRNLCGQGPSMKIGQFVGNFMPVIEGRFIKNLKKLP